MVFNILPQEDIEDLVHARWVQVTIDPVSLFLETSVGFLQVRGAAIVCDELVTLVVEVVSSLLDQRGLELLLIDPL